jgi:3-dehydroquinate dehydratase II
MKILVINGPNLNMLGLRDSSIYGKLTLIQINNLLTKIAKQNNVKLIFFQSNHEGEIIDFLQQESNTARGILINPGALTHYSYSLRDSLIDTKLPTVEVHLSDINNREGFRKKDVLEDIISAKYIGLKEQSYIKGLEFLINFLNK